MLKRKSNPRNAKDARNSFVTRRAETKLNSLADMFKVASGGHWKRTDSSTLQRILHWKDFHYLDTMRLIYNWENRFMSVNYNLQIGATFQAKENQQNQENTQDYRLQLQCSQKGLTGSRKYSWQKIHWDGDEEKKESCLSRLSHPYILERLDALDIMEMELVHQSEESTWYLSCESLIGSASWILIPPVFSLVKPTLKECTKFLELFDLIGDALINE